MGLKQKIRQKAKSSQWIQERTENHKRFDTTLPFRGKTSEKVWIHQDDVVAVLDEATKQIQEMVVATTLEHTHPSPEFWKGWNKVIDRVLAVLEGETKK